MFELINKIQAVNKKIVFVGGLSEVANGLKTKTKDIDIVVNNIKGLEVFGIIELFETKSPISKTGKRAFIKRNDYDIDIFIEKDEIDYFIKDGIKYQTLKKDSGIRCVQDAGDVTMPVLNIFHFLIVLIN